MAVYGVDVMLVKRVVTVGRSHHLFVLDAVVTGVALELGHFTVVVRVVLQRHPSNMVRGWEEIERKEAMTMLFMASWCRCGTG